MIWRRLSILLLILILAGCRSEVEITPAPASATPLAVFSRPQPVTIGTLAADPDLFLGQLLQLTGQFQPQPRLVCAAQPHPSPASWGLVADGYLAYVQGLPQVNQVAPPGLTITVEGRWRYWEGEVGCGADLVPQELYYLEITRILAPELITQATLTPPSGALGLLASLVETPVIGAPTAGPGEAEEATPPVIPGFPTPPEAAIPTPANQLTPFPTAPTGENRTPTATLPASSPTPENGDLPTTFPGSTPGTPSGTLSPTPNGTPPGTPGASPTEVGGTPATEVKKGLLPSQTLKTANLPRNEIHSWDIEIRASSAITVFATTMRTDINLSIYAPTQIEPVLTRSVAAGQVAALNFNTQAGLTYRLEVQTTNDLTEYGLLLQDPVGSTLVMRGVLVYGTSQNVRLPEERDHFWHFLGTAGDVLQIQVIPTGNGDPILIFYNADGMEDPEIIDENESGEEETYTITLAATGLYSILVGEYDRLEMTYTIFVIKSN